MRVIGFVSFLLIKTCYLVFIIVVLQQIKSNCMEKKFIESLKLRRIQLNEELRHIDSLLEIYNMERKQPLRVGKITPSEKTEKKTITKRGKRRKRKMSVEAQLIKVIRELGGKVYIKDVVDRLQEIEPKTEVSTLTARVRSYFQVMKNKGYLLVEPGKGRMVQYLLQEENIKENKKPRARKSATVKKAPVAKKPSEKPANPTPPEKK